MIATLELFEALKTKFSEPKTRIIVHEIEKIEIGVESKVEKAFELKKDVLATKEDIANLRIATKEDITNLQSHTDAKFNDQLKWIIIMWISQLAAIAALIKMLVK